METSSPWVAIIAIIAIVIIVFVAESYTDSPNEVTGNVVVNQCCDGPNEDFITPDACPAGTRKTSCANIDPNTVIFINE